MHKAIRKAKNKQRETPVTHAPRGKLHKKAAADEAGGAGDEAFMGSNGG
jgi:hypothetical protein